MIDEITWTPWKARRVQLLLKGMKEIEENYKNTTGNIDTVWEMPCSRDFNWESKRLVLKNHNKEVQLEISSYGDYFEIEKNFKVHWEVKAYEGNSFLEVVGNCVNGEQLELIVSSTSQRYVVVGGDKLRMTSAEVHQMKTTGKEVQIFDRLAEEMKMAWKGPVLSSLKQVHLEKDADEMFFLFLEMLIEDVVDDD